MTRRDISGRVRAKQSGDGGFHERGSARVMQQSRDGAAEQNRRGRRESGREREGEGGRGREREGEEEGRARCVRDGEIGEESYTSPPASHEE